MRMSPPGRGWGSVRGVCRQGGWYFFFLFSAFGFGEIGIDSEGRWILSETLAEVSSFLSFISDDVSVRL